MRLVVLVAATAACSFDTGFPPMPNPAADASNASDGPAVIDAGRDALVAPADTMSDARVCPPAIGGCVLFKCSSSTSCYYRCGTSSSGQVSWTTARNVCAQNGMGCIVTINSQPEQDCIVQNTNPVYPDNVWFGLRQSSGGSEPAGGWGWECPPSQYTSPAWGMYEPNNEGGDEDCGILATGGGWNDADCDTPSRFVCELL